MHVSIYPNARMPTTEFAALVRNIYKAERCNGGAFSASDFPSMSVPNNNSPTGSSGDGAGSSGHSSNSSPKPPENNAPSHGRNRTINKSTGSSGKKLSDAEERHCCEACESAWDYEQFYPHDALLFHVAQALFEMASNRIVDPNRAMRALYFHYSLDYPLISFESILTGDARTFYCAEALELCCDAPTVESEETRDYVRHKLEEITHISARYRADCDDCSDSESEPGLSAVCDVIVFGDNLDVVTKTQGADNLGAPCVDLSVLCAAVAVSAAENSAYAYLLTLLNMIAEQQLCAVKCEIGSITLSFERVPVHLARMLCQHLTANLHAAKYLTDCSIRSAQLPLEQATRVLGVVMNEDCAAIPYSPTWRYEDVFLTVLKTTDLPRARSLALCSAVSKYLVLLRDRVWKTVQADRIMVFCASSALSVTISLVLSGSEPSTIARRELLVNSMRSVTALRRIMRDPSGDVVGPCPSPLHLLFVFTVNMAVHNKAVYETKKCMNNVGIKYWEYANVGING